MHLAPEVDVTDLIKRCTIGRSNAAQLSSQLQEVAEHPDIRVCFFDFMTPCDDMIIILLPAALPRMSDVARANCGPASSHS